MSTHEPDGSLTRLCAASPKPHHLGIMHRLHADVTRCITPEADLASSAIIPAGPRRSHENTRYGLGRNGGKCRLTSVVAGHPPITRGDPSRRTRSVTAPRPLPNNRRRQTGTPRVRTIASGATDCPVGARFARRRVRTDQPPGSCPRSLACGACLPVWRPSDLGRRTPQESAVAREADRGFMSWTRSDGRSLANRGGGHLGS